MKKGDKIWITCEGRRVPGVILLASPNQVSLALGFEAMLAGFVGMMPVLLGDDGVYRTIMADMIEVKIEERQ